ncbi:MAG: glycan-binding surface protein [Dysgonamonadaceae bacterium]|jgi:hypothetical protein|nr:glycan-binding surface protein [Dysgonamonadaceae bacterium]
MNKKIILAVSLIFTLLFLAACNKEDADGCNGRPVIRGVKRTVLDSVTIETGALGDWLIVEGSDFCNIREIYFNDVKVNMANVYIEPALISLSVPRVAPYEVNHKITLVTALDVSVSFPFELYVPDVMVKGMLNEYAAPGGRGYIEGENFDIHQVDSTTGAWITFGDRELAVYRESSTRLSFEIPEDALPNTKIHLFRKDTLDNVRVSLSVPGYYKDTRNILYSGNPDRDKCDKNIERTDGLGMTGFPDSIAGAYYYYKGEYPNGAWGGKWRIYANVPMGQVMNQDGLYVKIWDLPSDEVEVVFEVNVVNDWTAAEFKINLWDGYWYYWRPYGGSAYRTNGWETIRIPLGEFKKTVGTAAEPYPTLTEGNIFWDWKNRGVEFNGGYQPNVFFCWDNMRIVPKE